MSVQIVNVRRDVWDVYIGRASPQFPEGSPFANPFNISFAEGRGRAEALDQYADWLWGEIEAGKITVRQLAALDGKRLGCFCKPAPCHGDVLAEAVKWAVEVLNGQQG